MPRPVPALTRLWPACFALILLLASSCSSDPTPRPGVTPSVAPSVVPSATRGATPAAEPATRPVSVATPTVELDRGAWQHIQGSGFAIDLPADWSPVELSPDSVRASLERFRENNSVLAALLGEPDVLQSLVLWASAPRGSGASQPFADNLSIRRLPLDGGRFANLPDVVTALEEQYREFGFTIGDSDPALSIAGSEAARVHYSYGMNDSAARPWIVTGDQYLIVTGSHLWILTFSSGSETSAQEKTFDEMINTLKIE